MTIRALRWLPPLMIALAPSVAEAEDASESSMPSRVAVLLPACDEPPFPPSEMIAALRVELLGDGVELGTTGQDADGVIAIESPGCSALRVTVRLHNGDRDRQVSRQLELGDRPLGDRCRIVALAVAELLRSEWSGIDAPVVEVEQPSSSPRNGFGDDIAPPVAPPGPTIDADVLREEVTEDVLEAFERRQAAAVERLRRLLIGAGVTVQTYPAYYGVLFGGRLSFDLLLSSRVPLHLGLDGGYAAGSASTMLGRIATRAASGALVLRAEGGTDRVRGGIGLRLELGWAQVEGEPASDDIQAARGESVLLNLAARGTFRARIVPRLWFLTEVDVGWCLVGLDAFAEEHHAGGIAGPLVHLTLGLAVGLW